VPGSSLGPVREELGQGFQLGYGIAVEFGCGLGREGFEKLGDASEQGGRELYVEAASIVRVASSARVSGGFQPVEDDRHRRLTETGVLGQLGRAELPVKE
jgi:hypothetical protein